MTSVVAAQDPGPAATRAPELYDALLTSVGERVPAGDCSSVLAHWPQLGRSYDGLVILGQALHGWPDDFAPASFITADGRLDALHAVQGRNADRAEPMDWIATRPVRSSPFWTVARLRRH